MKTKIHVNQHVIKANRKNGLTGPVLTVKDYKHNRYTSTATVLLPDGSVAGKFIYSPDKPLSCGAHVWFETELNVEVE